MSQPAPQHTTEITLPKVTSDDPPAAKPNRHFSVLDLANTVDLSFLPKTLFLDLETPSPSWVVPWAGSAIPSRDRGSGGALELLSPYTHFVGDLSKPHRVQYHLYADDSPI